MAFRPLNRLADSPCVAALLNASAITALASWAAGSHLLVAALSQTATAAAAARSREQECWDRFGLSSEGACVAW